MPDVFKAISPHYAFSFLVDGGRASWISLGGVILCISGSEAMFADMGHFSHKAITVRPPLALPKSTTAMLMILPTMPCSDTEPFQQYVFIPHQSFLILMILCVCRSAPWRLCIRACCSSTLERQPIWRSIQRTMRSHTTGQSRSRSSGHALSLLWPARSSAASPSSRQPSPLSASQPCCPAFHLLRRACSACSLPSLHCYAIFQHASVAMPAPAGVSHLDCRSTVEYS